MVLPYIESHSLNGLQGVIQRRMSFVLQRQVGRFGHEPGQSVAAIAAAAQDAAHGAVAAARQSMTKFR